MAALFFYLAGFLVLYILTNHFLHKIRNLPPCPYPSLPIIGHLYLLKKPLHRTLFNICNKHGPILFFQFGSRPVLVISSPSLAEECLNKNDIIFANRPHLVLGKHLGYNFTSLAWSSYGDHWRNLRRISSIEILSTYRLQMLSSIRMDQIKSMIQTFRDKQNQTVEMRTVFFELSFNNMMSMIAGKRYYGEDVADSEEAKRFQKMTADSTLLGGATYIKDFLPFMGWIGLGGKEESLIELHRDRDAFMQNLIEEHRSRKESKSEKTMIEVLLSLQGKEPKYYNDEMIRALIQVLLAAASDTTANTMEWALTLMLNHPEVMKKAQMEIDKQVGADHLIDESDIVQLPYLSSIIKETLRMFPPLPLSFPHESSQECSVGGFRVPRGTMLFMNLWGIHNDPKIWVDPTKFKPERFEGLEGSRDGFKYMPFASGRRGCPGEGLAMRVVSLALGSLLQCFEWERISEEMEDLSESAAFTLTKAQSLQAKCRARPSMINVLSQI